FRTEKLSPSAPMVLRKWESRSPPFFMRAVQRKLYGSLLFRHIIKMDSKSKEHVFAMLDAFL
ncbi:MAG: hypothetical protein WAT22_05025, partial [Saprospiraceae bacterium]|nr:hypothetical protein [Saprospiraceae bacterium]